MDCTRRQDVAQDTLEKRLGAAADQLRANLDLLRLFRAKVAEQRLEGDIKQETFVAKLCTRWRCARLVHSHLPVIVDSIDKNRLLITAAKEIASLSAYGVQTTVSTCAVESYRMAAAT